MWHHLSIEDTLRTGTPGDQDGDPPSPALPPDSPDIQPPVGHQHSCGQLRKYNKISDRLSVCQCCILSLLYLSVVSFYILFCNFSVMMLLSACLSVCLFICISIYRLCGNQHLSVSLSLSLSLSLSHINNLSLSLTAWLTFCLSISLSINFVIINTSLSLSLFVSPFSLCSISNPYICFVKE